jgi:hypothetical protein
MTTMRISTRAVAVIGLTAILGLSACKQEQPADALQENAMAEAPIENVTPAVNQAEVIPPVTGPINAVNMAAPPPAFTDKQQIQDDADATGMTARMPNDNPDAPVGGGNMVQPAQQ